MDYDALFKQVLLSPESRLLRAIAGANAVEQLNCEFSAVERRSSDIVCRLTDGRILHVEVQSTNDPLMAWRMAYYCLLLAGRYPGEPISQILLYVGNPELRMPDRFDLPALQFSYAQVDIRRLDPAVFLESPVIAELAISILCGAGTPHSKIQLLVKRWRGLTRRERDSVLEQLVIASKLRGEFSRLEVRQMAIEITEEEDRANEEALLEICEGLTRGRIRDRIECERAIAMLRRMICGKFGNPPEWVEQRLLAATNRELDNFADRLVTARTLEAMFDPQEP